MARPKIPRKSTNIDMTAMCDVAFLLLSFFILTTKFKPSEAVAVTPPKSVSSKPAPSKDFVLVTIDKDGRVFLTIDDKSKKEFIAESIKNSKNLNINVKEFVNNEMIGTSFAQLPQFLSLSSEERKRVALPGIPCKDSSNNEMIEWMSILKNAYMGTKMDLLLKGDNSSKYPAFKNVVAAFKKNDILKFQMVTNPENAPAGTELYRKQQAGIKSEE